MNPIHFTDPWYLTVISVTFLFFMLLVKITSNLE